MSLLFWPSAKFQSIPRVSLHVVWFAYHFGPEHETNEKWNFFRFDGIELMFLQFWIVLLPLTKNWKNWICILLDKTDLQTVSYTCGTTPFGIQSSRRKNKRLNFCSLYVGGDETRSGYVPYLQAWSKHFWPRTYLEVHMTKKE